jgi:glycosyltransferase involved in cell wall biosynthesis
MVLAQTFATDARVRREAKALADSGYSVKIVSWNREGERPLEERLDQCRVLNIRLGKSTAVSISRSSRLHYCIAALVFQLVILISVVREIARVHTLVLHAHDFNTLPGSVIAKKLFRSRVLLVYDSHELTPAIYQEWYGDLISGIVGRLELTAIADVDSMLAASEAIFRHLRRSTSVPAAVFYTCPAIDEIPKIPRAVAKVKLGLSGSFVVLFAGKVRQDFAIDMMFNAAHNLKRKGCSEFKFVFVGFADTMSWVASRAVKEGVDSLFVFKGFLPYQELLLHYLGSDLCFAVTRDLGLNTRTMISIKLFESMACGLPVLAREGTAVAGIVQKYGCGIVVKEGSDFAEELIRLSRSESMLQVLGQSGRGAFVTEYNLGRMQTRLLRVYAEMLSRESNPHETGMTSHEQRRPVSGREILDVLSPHHADSLPILETS